MARYIELMHGVLSTGVRVLPAAALVSAELGASGTVHSAVINYRGQNTTVGTAAVIIATGGFDRSEPLRRRLLRSPVAATGAGPANTGDALRIAGQLERFVNEALPYNDHGLPGWPGCS